MKVARFSLMEREHRGRAQRAGIGGRYGGRHRGQAQTVTGVQIQAQGAGTGSPVPPCHVQLQKLHTALLWRLCFGAGGLRRHPYKSERVGTVTEALRGILEQNSSQSILGLSAWEGTISAPMKTGSNPYRPSASSWQGRYCFLGYHMMLTRLLFSPETSAPGHRPISD